MLAGIVAKNVLPIDDHQTGIKRNKNPKKFDKIFHEINSEIVVKLLLQK